MLLRSLVRESSWSTYERRCSCSASLPNWCSSIKQWASATSISNQVRPPLTIYRSPFSLLALYLFTSLFIEKYKNYTEYGFSRCLSLAVTVSVWSPWCIFLLDWWINRFSPPLEMLIIMWSNMFLIWPPSSYRCSVRLLKCYKAHNVTVNDKVLQELQNVLWTTVLR